jgi:hypothetical protein
MGSTVHVLEEALALEGLVDLVGGDESQPTPTMSQRMFFMKFAP